tara:strand:+ start:2761 stop:3021 length:261 start_codon:yes stop_codon:yes gene_type:complete
MILEHTIGTLDELFDNFIEEYQNGNFTEGVCSWNGDDALMPPKSFAHKFKKMAIEMGFDFDQYKPYADELEDWCQDHLLHLESKFR